LGGGHINFRVFGEDSGQISQFSKGCQRRAAKARENGHGNGCQEARSFDTIPKKKKKKS